MLELADALEPADAPQKLADVLRPPPLAVGDDVEPGLLLQPDGEDDEVVHPAAERFRRQRVALGEQIAHGLRAGERPDAVGVKRRELGGARGFHAVIRVKW